MSAGEVIATEPAQHAIIVEAAVSAMLNFGRNVNIHTSIMNVLLKVLALKGLEFACTKLH
jgi:hypothetical protein